MALRLLLYVIVSLAAAAGCWFYFENNYSPYQFASEEAQKSLEVTPEQAAELDSSRHQSDMIVFGVFGALISAIGGVLCNPRPNGAGKIRGAVAGLVLGAIAGAGTACLGHWFDGAVDFPRDPMVYWIERWGLMLLPICLSLGLAAAIAGDFANDIALSLVGAIIGGAAATIVYCLLSGVVTEIESHQYVYPGFSMSRLMVLMLSAALIGGVALVQLGRTSGRAKTAEITETAS